MVCGVVVRLLRYASASRLCQLPRMVCGVFIISYTYASMSIVRHTMPVVLFGGIFATVPLLGVVMRYTIPPLCFVNYVGMVSRHRLCRSTNSYVPRCLVRAISVSADYSIFIRCSLFLTQNEQKLHIYAPKFANVAKMYYLCSAQCIGNITYCIFYC